MLASLASASNDAHLVIDSKDSGLCLGLDSPDTQYCQNETVIIDGTADHILYILPQSELSQDSNSTTIAHYAFFEPITMVAGGFGYVFLLLALFAGMIYALSTAFNKLSRPGGRR